MLHFWVSHMQRLAGTEFQQNETTFGLTGQLHFVLASLGLTLG